MSPISCAIIAVLSACVGLLAMACADGRNYPHL